MPRNQKPNGTNAPKCDFPDLLDMRPCPTRTLQMELPFTGRTPQIGIKVPPNRQGQKGPGLHSRRLTKLLAGVLQGTKYLLSDPPKVVSSWSGRLGQCGEEKMKVSSRQRKPGQLLERPLPYSPRQLRGSAAKMVEGVWSRPSPTAGEPWQSDLREIRQPSTPPEEAGAERNPQASNQAEWPWGAACQWSDPGRASRFVAKILAFCASMSNRNTETKLWWRSKEWFYYFARQRGTEQASTSRTDPDVVKNNVA